MLMELADFYARYSMAENNSCRVLRVVCRKCYQMIAEAQAVLSIDHMRRVKRYLSGNYTVDTYPSIYANPAFAGWMESVEVPVVDGGRWAIRHCTSYCAFKMREVTGLWPARKTAPMVAGGGESGPILSVMFWTRRPVCHAKDWLQMLQEMGYETVMEVNNTHHYIGVARTKGKYGEVVWFERRGLNDQIVVSTYRQEQHCTFAVEPGEYTWVKIV